MLRLSLAVFFSSGLKAVMGSVYLLVPVGIEGGQSLGQDVGELLLLFPFSVDLLAEGVDMFGVGVKGMGGVVVFLLGGVEGGVKWFLLFQQLLPLDLVALHLFALLFVGGD